MNAFIILFKQTKTKIRIALKNTTANNNNK